MNKRGVKLLKEKAVFCAKMTSTQWSEIANHILKICMPPASPMHMFVTQYMRLQFDREREESYGEKRTMIVGIYAIKYDQYSRVLVSATHTDSLFFAFSRVVS